MSKGEVTFYGIADLSVIYDSVQNLGGEAAGNAAVARDGTYQGENSRLQFSPRGSRFGFRLAAPDFSGIKVTGVVEADFVGTLPAGTEGTFYTSPILRLRHAWARISTSAFDLTFGQTWTLFGWVPSSVGYSVMVPGLPGEVYQRNPQLRLSKVIKGDAVNIEMAVAAVRPAQRDSSIPDGSAGVRVLVNKLQGFRTPGPAPGVVEPMSIGVSGLVRRFKAPEFVEDAAVTDTMTTTGFGVALSVVIPIIPPVSREEHAGALTLTGEAVLGEGVSDQYTGLTGGVQLPTALPGPDPATPGPAYNAGIDNGMVAINLDGELEAVKWTSFCGGLQFYVTNNVWLAANGSYLKSSNVADLTSAARAGAVYDKAYFFDGIVAMNITSAARMGLEFGSFHQTYVDDEKASSFRLQLGSWFMF